MGLSARDYINELTHIEREAGYAILCEEDDDEWRSCIDDFNRIYDRLVDLDAEIGRRFSPLSWHDSAGTVRMVVRDVIFYLDR